MSPRVFSRLQGPIQGSRTGAGVEVEVPKEGCGCQIRWFYPEEGTRSVT